MENTVTTKARVNMRATASTSEDNVQTILPEGTSLSVESYDDTWAYVTNAAGVAGFVMTQFLNGLND